MQNINIIIVDWCLHFQAMCADDNVMSRVLESYKMMLDFYGMKLTDSGNY